ncbi:energy-coupling factor transporter transmembrane protein EcfT [Erysipelotrichaceae bacterium OttesenSCG-928-M19]|nr:energy-coupling factor transporter transmembrane protein EcfT [Erysipelotrichaceae bacterium OttesenSCG-928-M19]
MREFKTFHPFVNLLYFVAVIFFTMFLTHPIFLILSFITSLIFLIKAVGLSEVKSKLLYLSVFFIVLALVNPLFVHKGATPLFYMNGNAVTLEACIYGIVFALMLISVIFWFFSFNKIMTSDKIIYVFSTFMPTIGLMISMILRFIPRFQTQLKKIIEMNKIGDNPYKSKSIIRRLGVIFKTFSILVTWAFENSIDTANTMKARGYGLKNRTTFHLYKFELRDIIFIVFIVVNLLLNIYLYFSLNMRFYYYPEISPITIDLGSIINYLSYFLLLLMPIIIEIKEEIRWKLLLSKI